MSDYNNWKPGDVAMVTRDDGHEAVAVRGRHAWSQAGPYGWATLVRHAEVTRIRPLAVIDPEDREQVKRLRDATLARAIEDQEFTVLDLANSLQAALREYANPTPPKPDEPTGHLAIVEDRDGRRWVSLRDPRGRQVPHERPWMLTELDTDECRDYADIDVTEVIYAGVTE